MEPGDIATWAGVGVALLVGASALAVSLRQIRQQERQNLINERAAEASHRQAEAAERRAIAVEETLQRLGNTSPLGGQEAADVQWNLERRKDLFTLRNVGTTTAEGVRVLPENLPPITRNLPDNASVRPQEAVEFFMVGTWGEPVPPQIMVAWDGREAVVAVPSKQ
jgi:hypothetical protein